jgi:hypothetical protein
MTTTDNLRRQLELHMSAADRLLEKLTQAERFGEDDWPEGTIIVFDKQFAGGGTTYHYAAIKAPSHLRSGGGWYTTEPRAPKDYSWEDLIAWIQEGPESSIDLYVVSELKHIDEYL